jgi:hypothetical protein
MFIIRANLNMDLPDHRMFWAASCSAWFGFLRVGEFTTPPSGFNPAVHLSLADIEVDVPSAPSAVLLGIKASKTDPFRKGVKLFLARTDGPLCPVSALAHYLRGRGGAPGPLFIFADGSPLSRIHVTNWLRSLMAAAGVQGNFSSHSYRIGAATTANSAGVPDSVIRSMGRWSSDAYLAYIRTSHETLRSIASRLASPN